MDIAAILARVDQICSASEAMIAFASRTMIDARARIDNSRALIESIEQRLEHAGSRRLSTLSPDIEIAALMRLNQMTMRFLHTRSVATLLEDALDALRLVTDAPLGNVQLLNPATGMLNIVAHHGFRGDFLDFFAEVPAHGSACGVSLRDRRRVIVSNVLVDPAFTEESRRAMIRADVHAVQSTPLVGVSGTVIGVVSTHYREPRVTQRRALRIVDLYASQIATLLEASPVAANGAPVPA